MKVPAITDTLLVDLLVSVRRPRYPRGMSRRPARAPEPTPPGPGGLYDVHLLSRRLGLTVGTLRGYVYDAPSWLIPPQRLGNKLVWTEQDAATMEVARRTTTGAPTA